VGLSKSHTFTLTTAWRPGDDTADRHERLFSASSTQVRHIFSAVRS
jgi:hypothetical protein